MALNEQTSDEIKEKALKLWKHPDPEVRSLAGSAISQVDEKKQTSEELGTLASKLFRNHPDPEVRSLAGSVLTQMPDKDS